MSQIACEQIQQDVLNPSKLYDDKIHIDFFLLQLMNLKKCLIIYFTLEQYIFIESRLNDKYHFDKHKIDKRYGSFIAAIAKIKPKIIGEKLSEKQLEERIGIELNKYIKMLSWNYDLQFEINLARLFINKKIHFLQSSFQIFPNENSIFEVENFKFDINKFSIIKLNGNAIWNMKEEYQRLVYTQTIFDYNTLVNDSGELLGFFLEQY